MRAKSYGRAGAVLVALVVAAAIPAVVHSPYYLDLLIMVAVNALLALTFIIMLRVGLINLSITVFWGIGAYASAVLTVKLHWSFWAALPTSTLITAVVALGLGYLMIGHKITGFSFVVLSAVVAMLFTSVISYIKYLGSYSGIPAIPAPAPVKLPFAHVIEFTSKVPFYYLALILAVIVIVVYKVLNASWIGRAWSATGADPRLAESTGVDTFRYKLLAFVLSSAFAGLVGSFYASYQGFIAPNTFGMWQNINVQVFAFLGGVMFPVLGPIVGALIMTFLTEILRPMSSIAPLVSGALLIILVIFLPQGLVGLFRPRGLGYGWMAGKSRSELWAAALRAVGLRRSTT
jgi:branched-chain amino acid transport system permease protein